MEVNEMIINKAFKFRIYPNQTQAILINKTIGCS
ncbi:transposase, partial [Bacillus cereus]